MKRKLIFQSIIMSLICLSLLGAGILSSRDSAIEIQSNYNAVNEGYFIDWVRTSLNNESEYLIRYCVNASITDIGVRGNRTETHCNEYVSDTLDRRAVQTKVLNLSTDLFEKETAINPEYEEKLR